MDEIKRRLRPGVGNCRRRADIDVQGKAALEALLREGGVPDVILECQCFGLGSAVSVIRAQLQVRGWLLAVTCPKRYATWNEIFEVRYQLVPEDVTMVLPVPSSDRLVSFHPNTFLLWQQL